MSIQVRQATIDDIDAVAPLFDAYRQFYRQPSDPERSRQFLRERQAHCESTIFLAVDADGAALGFTQLYPLFSSVRCVRIWLLNDLFVTPAARKRGVGAKLLTAAAAFARANGAASLSLSTASDNTAAQRLYAALGWKRETGFLEYHLPL
ncbi:MAG: GNAT family N-acetyltransferase [Proteobacteria bacterium]|uniref:GNAT family N-acetyltransferase n=1 Tax=Rudaea sp. TaxID=2136325 RepID=UPI00321FAC77|nr:GNAT family N-acetyltransferase [Pseudomonadota bacterium]